MDLRETTGIFAVLDRIRDIERTMERLQRDQLQTLERIEKSIRSLRAQMKSRQSFLKDTFGGSWMSWIGGALVLHYLTKGGDLGTAISWIIKLK